MDICKWCRHDHTELPWRDEDPADGTCWSTAGPLVCGCPKMEPFTVVSLHEAFREEHNRGYRAALRECAKKNEDLMREMKQEEQRLSPFRVGIGGNIR